MKLKLIALTLFLIFLVPAFLCAQEKSSKEKDKKSESKPVEVKANVAVLDSNGNPDGDVKLEDLKIFEDGTEQKITYFAKKEPVVNVGLVMDNTGSMRMQLERIVRTGAAIVANLRPTDEAFVVRFVSSDKISIQQAWTSDKMRLGNALGNLYIEGGQSAVIDALYLSANEILARENKDAAKRYALVLITDAEDRASYYNLAQMLSLIEKKDVQIFVIALTKDLSDKKDVITKVKNQKTNAEKLARTLALETGGNAYVFSENYDDKNLLAAAKSIVAELNSQYVVGYASTNQKRDGALRKLTVQVADNAKGEKRQGAIRESFVVPKD